MAFSINNGNNYRTMLLTKDSSTVIRAGRLVALDGSKLAVEADATSTEVALAIDGAVSGETTVTVTVGNTFDMVGTADANFADSNKATEVDLVINGGEQEIDLGASTTDVLKVSAASNAGTVGSTEKVIVRINKPIY